ncbi:hypothetical protein [Luteimonas aquatica]|uniref:hypothetical protein n=1 Tax=Luteimonas aquatica TaxID=450364 RepID=UPI001F596084|nr:hypothetical protein [Luteimonas aquatica]
MNALLIVAFLGLVAWLVIRESRLHKARMQASFDDLRFPGAGDLRGRDMAVVKKVTETVAETWVGGIETGWWYCVGPGPSYYLVIVQPASAGWMRIRAHWLVRPLSEQRMRNALLGDPGALAAAFGEPATGFDASGDR